MHVCWDITFGKQLLKVEILFEEEGSMFLVFMSYEFLEEKKRGRIKWIFQEIKRREYE